MLTGPSKVVAGVLNVIDIDVEEPELKAIGVDGVIETTENPGVFAWILTTESGNAPCPAVNFKEYQNCCPGWSESIPFGWFGKLNELSAPKYNGSELL